MPNQRTRPSGAAIATQVNGRGTARVNATSSTGMPSARSVARSCTMRAAHRFAGMASSGRCSLTRIENGLGPLATASGSPAALRSAGAQRCAVRRATTRLRSM